MVVTGRRKFIFGSAAVLILSTSLSAQQKQPEPRKMTNAEKKEIQVIQKMVDDAQAAGTMPDNALNLVWQHNDLLKAQGNKQYLPFNVTVDPTKVDGGKLTFYWRVVAADAAAATDDKGKKKESARKDGRPEFAYEDLSSIALKPEDGNPARISRSFTVAPGQYDVFVVAKETTPEKPAKNAPPPKVSLIKQSVTVPDLWNGELSTSSVIVAERIDPLAVAPTPQQQSDRPYALGNIEIVPALKSQFGKKAELSTFLLIYNTKTDQANKPDVTVEYNFYAKQGGSEKFFNKTNPQALNAQTLPPDFDLAAGHQLQSGQAVPLASFPEGDYRLEIKVTDKIANKSLTRDVNFTVAGS